MPVSSAAAAAACPAPRGKKRSNLIVYTNKAMDGTITEDYGMSLRSSALEEMLSEQQRCLSGDLIAEWRSSEQVENGTTSTSPPYWDTDDDDDCGPKPADLYGRFTWKIENYSTINKRELRSNAFEVGGYKWYILIYPQGCDVCNHLSLFLCVANHDKLLPGWSHFAQFTIAIVNKDAKKSKHSDTLHRFWKKEHDWGWKKFMELSKVYDGFIVADTLVIKAQVQVIREKVDCPFRCLDGQYRRELVWVYLSNVEQICKRFLDKKIGELSTFIEDKMSWSSFRAFWLGIDPDARRCMSRDRTDAILKVVVKHFFIEKEVASTLVMDSLYSGLKALEYQSKNTKGRAKVVDLEELPAPMVHVDKDLFVLADDVIALIERVIADSLSSQPVPSKENKCTQIRSKDGSSGDDISKDSVERDERRLMELGYRTLEIFVLVHIFSSRIEVSYQEAVALKRQEELIREEEAAGLAENELKSKRSANDKEKRTKKKQAKQKRNVRKGKDRVKDEKYNQALERQQQETLLEERISENCPSEQAELAFEKIDTPDDASDASGADDAAEVLQPDLDDRDVSPVTPETDASEIRLGSESSGSGVQNGHIDKRTQSTLDDGSLTCSTDPVPSSLAIGPNKGSILVNNKKSQSSPNRGRNQRSKETHDRTGSSLVSPNPPSETAINSRLHDANGSKIFKRELEATLVSLKSKIRQLEKHLVEKDDDVATTQKEPISREQVVMEKQQFSPVLNKKPTIIHQPQKKSLGLNNTITVTSISTSAVELASSNGPSLNNTAQADKVLTLAPRSPPASSSWTGEAQKLVTPAKISSSLQTNATSRPYSAPIVPAPRLNAPMVSTVQSGPLLSRSASATGRLGTEPSPQTPTHIPQSYRNAIMGEPSSLQGAGSVDDATSSGQSVAYSQSPSMFVSATPTIPSQTHPGNDQTSARPLLTFGCLREAVHSQHLRTDDSHHESSCSSSSQRFGSSLAVNMEKLDIYGRSRKEQYQVQGTTAEEFPHLDIINDLLDEEHNVARTVRDPRLPFNRQYTFPGNLPTNIGLLTSSGLFDRSELYYDGFESYAASSNPLQGFREERLEKSADLSSYASNSRFDGLMRNQWPYWNSDVSMLSARDGDANGYFYHLQDYLGRDGNRYLYRPY